MGCSNCVSSVCSCVIASSSSVSVTGSGSVSSPYVPSIKIDTCANNKAIINAGGLCVQESLTSLTVNGAGQLIYVDENGASTSIDPCTLLSFISVNCLGDVNTAGVTNGQVLAYNGSAWVPVTIAPGGITGIVDGNGAALPITSSTVSTCDILSMATPTTTGRVMLKSTTSDCKPGVVAAATCGQFLYNNNDGVAGDLKLGKPLFTTGFDSLTGKFFQFAPGAIGVTVQSEQVNDTYINNNCYDTIVVYMADVEMFIGFADAASNPALQMTPYIRSERNMTGAVAANNWFTTSRADNFSKGSTLANPISIRTVVTISCRVPAGLGNTFYYGGFGLVQTTGFSGNWFVQSQSRRLIEYRA